jgi:hypothetical protein
VAGRSIFLCALLSLCGSAGCGQGRYDVSVSFEGDVTADDVRFIELSILPACPPASEVISGQAPTGKVVAGVGLAREDASSLPVPDGVAPGVYGLYARAFDASCTARAAGCVAIELERGGSGRLSVALEPTQPVDACSGEGVCLDGRCGRPDAGTGPGDACASSPCGSDEYCTDLADPAPATPAGRTCTDVTKCTNDEFESAAPTATSDRVCAPCDEACTYCDGPSAADCLACPAGSYLSPGGCLELSTCGTGQYQATAPTATTDRVCATCTICTGTEYEVVACADGDGAADRVCAPLTECGLGQYQSTAPTATSDRVCATCAVCNAGQYERVACADGNAPQDRVCTPLTSCTAGQYESAAPTATTDRGCSACATCSASQYESAACADGNAAQNRACAPLTHCGTGHYESVAPTATTDRVCSECVMICGAGMYEAAACANGDAPQDRVCATCDGLCVNCNGPTSAECTACGPGFYHDGGSCVPLTPCGEGQYESVAPTSTSDRVCSPCAPECGAGTYERVACADGNSPQDRVCEALTDCAEGQYESAAPTEASDRVCSACTACAAGQYETMACADGNASQNRVCKALTDCIVGQYESVPPTATSNRACSACTVCAPDQYDASPCADGNAPGDRVCGGGVATCTLEAAADAAVDNYSGSHASGTAATMATGDDTVSHFYSFLRFDVASGACAEGGTIPAGATIQSVTLALQQTASCPGCARPHRLERVTEAWSEATIAPGSGPGVSAAVSATFDALAGPGAVDVSGGSLAADVQSFLDAPAGNHGYRLGMVPGIANGASPYRWATRESATSAERPRLSITYERP